MQTSSDNIFFLIIIGMAGVGLLAVSLILFSIRNRNRLLLQQRKMQDAELAHQKNLLHTIITSQEEERKRIGSDLHDEVGSALSSLRLIIENFAEITPGETVAAFRKQSKQIIDRVIADTRNISHNLSPIASGEYAFADALEDLCDQVNQSGRISVFLNFDAGEAETRLRHEEALALYRVLSELINNSVKHAGGHSIWIDFTIDSGQALLIAYKDDGKGIDASQQKKKGMGMGNVESRLGMIGATYSITTAPGKGFHILIRLPKTY